MSTTLLLRYTSLILGVWLMLAGVCFAKQVYQKDGGIIECESFRRQGNVVVVKINRDILIELPAGEIDLKRTFTKARKQPAHLRREKPARGVVPSLAAAPADAAATIPGSKAPAASAPAPTEKSTPPPAPTAAPIAKVAPSPDPTAVPAAKDALQAPAPAAATDSAAPLDKAEFERRTKENAEMMATALQKQDPEMLKKAVEAQKALRPQNQEQKAEAVAKGGKYLLLLLAFSVIVLASLWVVFKKAGRSGVASIIPFYNMYVLLEISGKPGWWLVLLIIPGAGFVFQLLAMLSLAERFGRGALYGLGLFFLPMFFFPLLGFGSAQYEA